MKIGSSTGYVPEIMDVLVPLAAELGYRPDCVVTASDVPEGRPAPWMCLENARRFGIYPMESMVKVDDTPVGIAAGLNAGMWTVGIVVSGNEVGLSEQELAALDAADRNARIERAREKLSLSGAHWVIDTIADLPGVLDEIAAILVRGERP
jgi:phosphonoacetaldehyde hydrolase